MSESNFAFRTLNRAASRLQVIIWLAVLLVMGLSPRLVSAQMSPPATPPAGTNVHVTFTISDANGLNQTPYTLTWSNADQMWEDASWPGGHSLQLDGSSSTVTVTGGSPPAQTWGASAVWDFVLSEAIVSGGWTGSTVVIYEAFYGNSVPYSDGTLVSIPNPNVTNIWSDLDPVTGFCEFAPISCFTLNALSSNNGHKLVSGSNFGP